MTQKFTKNISHMIHPFPCHIIHGENDAQFLQVHLTLLNGVKRVTNTSQSA